MGVVDDKDRLENKTFIRWSICQPYCEAIDRAIKKEQRLVFKKAAIALSNFCSPKDSAMDLSAWEKQMAIEKQRQNVKSDFYIMGSTSRG